MTTIEIQLQLLELTAAHYLRRWEASKEPYTSESELSMLDGEYLAKKSQLEVDLFKEQNKLILNIAKELKK